MGVDKKLTQVWRYILRLTFSLPSGAVITGSSTFELITDRQLSGIDKANIQSLFKILSEERLE